MSFWTATLGFVKLAIAAVNPIVLLVGVGIAWAISEALSTDTEKDTSKKYEGTLLNKQSNNAQIPVVYGQRRVGGTRVFLASSGDDNLYLYVVLVLCEGEIEEIGDIYINDVISTDARYSTLVSINKHLGSDSQSADSMLTGAGIGWTSSHALKGLAYIACRFMWDANVFGSTPNITCDIKGRKVFNPANSQTAYSTNPALCWRDYVTNSRYGKGLPSSSIDDDSVATAKSDCDTLVTPYTGGSQVKIFECNAVIDTSRSTMDNTKILLSGMRALMPFSEGKYGVVVEGEKVGNSVFSFTEDHIIGGISIESERKSSKYNRVIATFSNPLKGYQSDQIEWPKSGSSTHTTYLSEDDDLDLVGRLDLSTITNPYSAEDIAELMVKRSRSGLKVAMVVSSEGMICSVGDIISITHSTPSWSAKDFRVMGVVLNSDCTVQIECMEHQDNIYPWGTKTQEASSPNTNLPTNILNSIMDVYSQSNSADASPSVSHSVNSGAKFWTIYTTSEAISLSNKKLHLTFDGKIDYEGAGYNTSQYYYGRWAAGWFLAGSDGIPLCTANNQYINSGSVILIANVDGGSVSLGTHIFGGASGSDYDEQFFTIATQQKFAQNFSLAANTHYKISDGSLVTTETKEFKLVFGVVTAQSTQFKDLNSWESVNTYVTVFAR